MKSISNGSFLLCGVAVGLLTSNVQGLRFLLKNQQDKCPNLLINFTLESKCLDQDFVKTTDPNSYLVQRAETQSLWRFDKSDFKANAELCYLGPAKPWSENIYHTSNKTSVYGDKIEPKLAAWNFKLKSNETYPSHSLHMSVIRVDGSPNKTDYNHLTLRLTSNAYRTSKETVQSACTTFWEAIGNGEENAKNDFYEAVMKQGKVDDKMVDALVNPEDLDACLDTAGDNGITTMEQKKHGFDIILRIHRETCDKVVYALGYEAGTKKRKIRKNGVDVLRKELGLEYATLNYNVLKRCHQEYYKLHDTLTEEHYARLAELDENVTTSTIGDAPDATVQKITPEKRLFNGEKPLKFLLHQKGLTYIGNSLQSPLTSDNGTVIGSSWAKPPSKPAALTHSFRHRVLFPIFEEFGKSVCEATKVNTNINTDDDFRKCMGNLMKMRCKCQKPKSGWNPPEICL